MVYLIRHAQSEFNLADSKSPDEYENIFASNEYVDCGITEKGFEQCKDAKQLIDKYKIDLILCSPLKRAIQTAIEIFGENIPIQINKYMTECIQASCDVSDLRETQSYFQNQIQKGILKFNDLDIDWQISLLQDTNIQEQLKNSVNNGKDQNQSFLDLFKEFKKDNKSLENYQSLIERTKIFKKFLSNFLKENPGKNIALVGHWNYFRYMMAEQFDQNLKPVNSKILKNCEIFEFQFN